MATAMYFASHYNDIFDNDKNSDWGGIFILSDGIYKFK